MIGIRPLTPSLPPSFLQRAVGVLPTKMACTWRVCEARHCSSHMANRANSQPMQAPTSTDSNTAFGAWLRRAPSSDSHAGPARASMPASYADALREPNSAERQRMSCTCHNDGTNVGSPPPFGPPIEPNIGPPLEPKIEPKIEPNIGRIAGDAASQCGGDDATAGRTIHRVSADESWRHSFGGRASKASCGDARAIIARCNRRVAAIGKLCVSATTTAHASQRIACSIAHTREAGSSGTSTKTERSRLCPSGNSPRNPVIRQRGLGQTRRPIQTIERPRPVPSWVPSWSPSRELALTPIARIAVCTRCSKTPIGASHARRQDRELARESMPELANSSLHDAMRGTQSPIHSWRPRHGKPPASAASMDAHPVGMRAMPATEVAMVSEAA